MNRLSQIAIKIPEKPQIRTGEAVDGLPIISNTVEVYMRVDLTNCRDQSIEQFREVLIFINGNILDFGQIAVRILPLKYRMES